MSPTKQRMELRLAVNQFLQLEARCAVEDIYVTITGGKLEQRTPTVTREGSMATFAYAVMMPYENLPERLKIRMWAERGQHAVKIGKGHVELSQLYQDHAVDFVVPLCGKETSRLGSLRIVVALTKPSCTGAETRQAPRPVHQEDHNLYSSTHGQPPAQGYPVVHSLALHGRCRHISPPSPVATRVNNGFQDSAPTAGPDALPCRSSRTVSRTDVQHPSTTSTPPLFSASSRSSSAPSSASVCHSPELSERKGKPGLRKRAVAAVGMGALGVIGVMELFAFSLA